MYPLKVLTYKNYDIEFLKKLESDCVVAIDKVNFILSKMVDDFYKLIGRELDILEVSEKIKPFQSTMKIIEGSWYIQMNEHIDSHNQKSSK